MSVVTYNLRRDRDPSGVSGTGPSVATVVEFESGLTAMHWNSPTPSVTIHTDVRHIEQINGHGGASTLVIAETRLESAYRVVMPYLLAGGHNPVVCGAHPDHPDRLRLVFATGDEAGWRRWIALLDGSTDVAVHEEIGGEVEHRWTSPFGDFWLMYHTRPTTPTDNPLDTYDREDR